MKNLLYLDQCLGSNKIARLCYFTQPPYSPNVVNQTVDYGGVTWKGNPGSGWTIQSMTGGGPAPGQAPSFQNVTDNANALNTQLQTNIQPAVSTLGSAATDLQGRYANLLSTIQGQGSVAVNAQTLATNNLMGARGIDTSQGYGQQQMASSLLPVTAQNQAAVANLGVNESNALVPIAQQIAGLQNTYPEAINAAFGLAGQQTAAAPGMLAAQNTAALIPSQEALNQAQANYYQNIPTQNPLMGGQSIYNTGNQTYSNPLSSLLTSLGMNVTSQNGVLGVNIK